MKYRFISALYNLKLEGNEKSIDFGGKGRISQSSDILNQTFNNRLAIDTIGVHSIDEFNGRVFYYLDGEFNQTIDEKLVHQNGTRFTFAILRVVQNYIFDLWKIKDNNVYVFDGFLLVYEKGIPDGFTFKGTLTGVLSNSDQSPKPSSFTKDELTETHHFFESINFEELLLKEINYSIPTYEHFFKSGNSNRVERAWYFSIAARMSYNLPTKIINYCIALECLFTSSQSELSHKVSERVAILHPGKNNGKINAYMWVKKAYGVRSTIVHGSVLKGSNDDLKILSTELDKILRYFLTNDFHVFSLKDDEFEEYFLSKLLK